MTATAQDVAINRIRWRCRRGMLELDLLLNRFLERHARALTKAQWQAFEQLIAQEDQVLWRALNVPVADTSPSSPSADDLLLELITR